MKKKNRSESVANITNRPLLVVIGASEGGLEAIKSLLTTLPPDTGMAFAYLQPFYEDTLSETVGLLAAATSMVVREVSHKVTLRPNVFYVLPSDKKIQITQGEF